MDRFSPISLLGRSGFCVTRLVLDKGSETKLVVRQLGLTRLPQIERDEAERYAAVLVELSHPHIVKHLEKFSEQGNLNLVREYVEGKDLQEVVNSRRPAMERFSDQDAVAVIAQILAALTYIHARNVMHGCLVCKNIFQLPLGSVKLGDFSVASVKAVTGAKGKAAPTGSQAPELCEGLPYSKATEIWCVGVVLYTLLTLYPPPEEDGESRDCSRLKSLIFPGDCADGVRKIVNKTLEKAPERRPSVAELFASDVVQRCRCFVFEDVDMQEASASEGGNIGDAVDKFLLIGGLEKPIERSRWNLDDAPPLKGVQQRSLSGSLLTKSSPACFPAADPLLQSRVSRSTTQGTESAFTTTSVVTRRQVPESKRIAFVPESSARAPSRSSLFASQGEFLLGTRLGSKPTGQKL